LAQVREVEGCFATDDAVDELLAALQEAISL
jgi:predicted RNase H-like HicB family nuclease